MLQFTSGVNDVELSLELANTAMNVATGHYYDEYGPAYAQQMGFTHTGFLRPGGNLVMKVYEVGWRGWCDRGWVGAVVCAMVWRIALGAPVAVLCALAESTSTPTA